METLLVLVVLALLLLPLGLAISRSSELFVLRVELGRVDLVRGRLPHGLLSDVRDVFERSQETGRVRVTVLRGVATVNVRGAISPVTVQKLRNVIGNVPLQRIRAGSVRGGRRERPRS